MILKTRTLIVECHYPDGRPIPGAPVTAALTPGYDIVAQGIVVPKYASAVADADGVARLQVVPNAIGSRNTRYAVRVGDGRGCIVVEATCYIPDGDPLVPLYLPQVMTGGPFPPLTEFEILALQVRADAVQVALDRKYVEDAIAGFDPGGGGGGTRYRHVQSTPAAVWTVPHNLGRWPSVSVTDNNGNLLASDVKYDPADNNILQVIHGAPYSGYAICN